MEPLLDIVGSLGVFLVGLLIRLAAFVLIVVVLAVPILLMLQGFEGLASLRRWALGVTRIGRLRWRSGVYYAPGHTWLAEVGRLELRVGLDDLAQQLLPGPNRVRLPEPGAKIRRGETVARIGVDGQEAEIVAPIGGTITAVNGAVRRDPSLIHRDPYVRGWLFRIRPADRSYRHLRRAELARDWLDAEGARLNRLLERELGFATADGGELVKPIHTLLETGQWKRIASSFLGQGTRV